MFAVCASGPRLRERITSAERAEARGVAIAIAGTWGKPWSKARSTRVRNWRAACLVEYYAKALLVSTRTVAQYASCG